MTENLNTIQNFLWEIHLIDHRKKKLKELDKVPNDEDRFEIIRDTFLMNLFLLRRMRDPGFYKFVSESVYKDQIILDKVKKYIHKLFADNIDKIDETIFPISSKENETQKINLEEEMKQPLTLISDHIEKRLNNFAKTKENSLKYLKKRLENAVNNEDTIEMGALKSLRFEFSSGAYAGHLNYTSPELYEGLTYPEYWSYIMKKYFLRNIKFLGQYSVPLSSIDLGLHELSAANVKLEKFVVNDILRTVLDTSNIINESVLIEYNKFINDIISIASVVWFNNRTEKERLEILNDYYPFSIKDDDIDEIYKLFENVELLLIIAQTLSLQGHLEEAKKLYQYTTSKTNEDQILSLCYDNIASICKEQEDYKTAIEFYNKSRNILENIDNELKYRIAIILKNIGESYYQLDKIKEAEEYFYKAEETIQIISKKEQTQVLWNLANASRRGYDFEREYKYLAKLMDFDTDEIEDNLSEDVSDRLLMLNNRIDLSSGELDSNFLKDRENKEKYNLFYNHGLKLYKSFQIESATEWFKKAYNVNNEPDVLNMIGSSFFNLKKYKDSRIYYETLINEYPYDFRGYVSLGILDIINNDIDTGITNISKAFELAFQKHLDYRLIFDLLIRNLINEGYEERLDLIIDKLGGNLPKSITEDLYFNDMGSLFTGQGFFEEGMSYYRKALKHTKSSENKSLILNNIGTNYTNQNMMDKAIKYYQKAIKTKLNYYPCWNNMASAYAYQYNFEKALECIEKAIEFAPEDKKEFFKSQRELFELFTANVLNLNYVTDAKIKKMLYGAEYLLIKINGEKKVDISSVLIGYSKALENILHTKVSSKIKEEIIKKYGKDIDNKLKSVPHPYYLKGLIIDEKTISLGYWCVILGKIGSSTKNSVGNDFRGYIENKYSIEKINIIKKACCNLNIHRNEAAHRDIKNKDEVMNIRKDIIPYLNKIINIFYMVDD